MYLFKVEVHIYQLILRFSILFFFINKTTVILEYLIGKYMLTNRLKIFINKILYDNFHLLFESKLTAHFNFTLLLPFMKLCRNTFYFAFIICILVYNKENSKLKSPLPYVIFYVELATLSSIDIVLVSFLT